MSILITGATGEIGKRVALSLYEKGYKIVVLSRSKQKAQEKLLCPAEIIEKDLIQEPLNESDFKDIDTVIHLMGENIDGRWSSAKKRKILESRVISSKNLIKNMPPTVKHIICASAQGYYQSSDKLNVTESAENGDDFLAEVCKGWELAMQPMSDRVTTLRIGLVLSTRMGALKKLISIFKKQIGAVLGTGEQWISWIALEDLNALITKLTIDQKPHGVLNAVADNPVRNKEFTHILAEQLDCILLPRVPSFILRIVLGEMSSLVLNSYHLSNAKTKQTGFKFEYETVRQYIEKVLQNKA